MEATEQIPDKLQLRPGDEQLPFEQLTQISIFRQLAKGDQAKLKGKPGRGAVVLRKYASGDVICSQGEAGWSAFYLITTEDLLALREAQGGGASRTGKNLDTIRGRAVRLTEAREADERLDELHPELRGLTPAQKRSKASELPEDEPRTAWLRASADGDEWRAKAEVSFDFPQTRRKRKRGGGFTALLASLFRSEKREVRREQSYIPFDGPVDLKYENPRDVLYEGELFGEMSCLTQMPRAATVRATQDCYVLEILQNILELLFKSQAFKDQMDAVYRERVLENHLRAIPIFRDAESGLLRRLRDHAELITLEPGEALFEEGDESDSMYVIRLGVVKVFCKWPGGERVLAYRSRGEILGEIGLVREQARSATCIAYKHPEAQTQHRKLAASPIPSNRVELLRIGKELFDELKQEYPGFGAKVEETANIRLAEDIKGKKEPPISISAEFDQLGLMQGQKLMVIDLDRCTRCDECVRACAATHDDGLARLFREGPRFGNFLVPSTCRECLDPVCMIGCPVGSIHKSDLGEIVIEDWCIGCERCAQQCPYDAISMQPVPIEEQDGGEKQRKTKPMAVVCDQCNPLGGTPSCVYACPHDAAFRADARTLFSDVLSQGSRR